MLTLGPFFTLFIVACAVTRELMPHRRSVEALASRRARAAERGYLSTVHHGFRHVLVPSGVASRVQVVSRSLELHRRHNELAGFPSHFAKSAAVAAKGLLVPSEFQNAIHTHKARDRATHVWSDCLDDDIVECDWAVRSATSPDEPTPGVFADAASQTEHTGPSVSILVQLQDQISAIASAVASIEGSLRAVTTLRLDELVPPPKSDWYDLAGAASVAAARTDEISTPGDPLVANACTIESTTALAQDECGALAHGPSGPPLRDSHVVDACTIEPTTPAPQGACGALAPGPSGPPQRSLRSSTSSLTKAACPFHRRFCGRCRTCRAQRIADVVWSSSPPSTDSGCLVAKFNNEPSIDVPLNDFSADSDQWDLITSPAALNRMRAHSSRVSGLHFLEMAASTRKTLVHLPEGRVRSPLWPASTHLACKGRQLAIWFPPGDHDLAHLRDEEQEIREFMGFLHGQDGLACFEVDEDAKFLQDMFRRADLPPSELRLQDMISPACSQSKH